MTEWNYERLKRIVDEKTQERFDLEFKICDELRWGEGIRDPQNKGESKSRESLIEELTRDISAMANSAGGVIIYGVEESHRTSTAKRLDSNPYTAQENNLARPEWLDEVIRANISPAPNVRIAPVFIDDDKTQGWYYAIEVEQGVTAHQAKDKKFYKRLNTTRAVMEQYEIVDVINRAKGPLIRAKWNYKYKGIREVPVIFSTLLGRDTISREFEELLLSLEFTSINYVSAEYGAFSVFVLYPLRIVGPQSAQPEDIGVTVGDYEEQAHAKMVSYNWSVHQTKGVYPGSWTPFKHIIQLQIPPVSAIPDPLYLLKTEVNAPNMPLRVAWHMFTPIPDPKNPWKIETTDLMISAYTEKFWNTYHLGRHYQENLR